MAQDEENLRSKLICYDCKSFAAYEDGQYLLKFFALIDVNVDGTWEIEQHMVADLSQPIPKTEQEREICNQQKMAAIQFYRVKNEREEQKKGYEPTCRQPGSDADAGCHAQRSKSATAKSAQY